MRICIVSYWKNIYYNNDIYNIIIILYNGKGVSGTDPQTHRESQPCSTTERLASFSSLFRFFWNIYYMMYCYHQQYLTSTKQQTKLVKLVNAAYFRSQVVGDIFLKIKTMTTNLYLFIFIIMLILARSSFCWPSMIKETTVNTTDTNACIILYCCSCYSVATKSFSDANTSALNAY